MALIFIPKIMFIRQHSHDPREKEDDEKENAEQERKYRELLKVNEDLQKKVAEVFSSKLTQCARRVGRRGCRAGEGSLSLTFGSRVLAEILKTLYSGSLSKILSRLQYLSNESIVAPVTSLLKNFQLSFFVSFFL